MSNKYGFNDLFVVVSAIQPSYPDDLYTSKEEAEKEADARNRVLVEEHGINSFKYVVLTLNEYIECRVEDKESQMYEMISESGGLKDD